jgi:2-polyprenyl-6-methoxyphenol hydroxylase-like FAD-dependent oxidoreductase
MYDVIVVGTRVAGASAAMLQARRGLKVLAVDQAVFPSDTLSTHQVQTPGVALLRRWGLLDRLQAAGTPPAHNVRFDTGFAVLSGCYPQIDGAGAVYSPRRTLLDHLLVEAARAAGAEVRERYLVEDLLVEDGRVCGIRGREKGAAAASVERAAFVVGADGKHSLVAKAVSAAVTRETAPLSLAAYTYWDGVHLEGGEMYSRPGFSVGLWPTNDHLVMSYVAWPVSELARVRHDIEAAMLRAFDGVGIGERFRSAQRAEKVRATTDTPNRIRKPFGAGWALVGDAGLVMDPLTGQGISHAFQEAELLSDAMSNVVQNGKDEATAMAGYWRARDRQIRAMYDFTVQTASFKPSVAGEVLFSALRGRQSEIDRFFGVMTGSVHLRDYMAPANMIRLVGLRGFLRVVTGQGARNAANQPELQAV